MAASPKGDAEIPDVVRIIAGAFEIILPNRAELRLKGTGKVIGYTLSLVKDTRGRDVGATLFFKDLTRVEQPRSASDSATASWRSAKWRRPSPTR